MGVHLDDPGIRLVGEPSQEVAKISRFTACKSAPRDVPERTESSKRGLPHGRP